VRGVVLWFSAEYGALQQRVAPDRRVEKTYHSRTSDQGRTGTVIRSTPVMKGAPMLELEQNGNEHHRHANSSHHNIEGRRRLLHRWCKIIALWSVTA
jgi:hypothetical protein